MPPIIIRKKRAVKYSLEYKLALLTQSIVEEFPNEPTFPGIKFAYLPNCNEFYGSIIRYKAVYGREGFVVCKAQHPTMEEVINSIIKQWTSRVKPTRNATEEFLKCQS